MTNARHTFLVSGKSVCLDLIARGLKHQLHLHSTQTFQVFHIHVTDSHDRSRDMSLPELSSLFESSQNTWRARQLFQVNDALDLPGTDISST